LAALAPFERLERRGADDVGRGRERFRLEERQRPDRRDQLRAVHQRQPLLRLQHQGAQAPPPLRLGRRQARAVERRLPLAHEHQRQVRQGSQVAGRPDRSLPGNHRQHAGVEMREERLHHLGADPRVPARQHVRAQQHEHAHGGLVERLSDPGRVAANQIELQLGDALGGDADVLEMAEAGVDAVHLPAFGDDAPHHLVRGLHPFASAGGEADPGARRDRGDRVEVEMAAVERDPGHGGRV
jgi:hypothetical protein